MIGHIYVQPPDTATGRLYRFMNEYPDSVCKRNPFAHCTLTRGSFREGTEPDIKRILDEVAKSERPFEIRVGDVVVIDDLLVVEAIAPELLRMHKKIIEGLARFLDTENPLPVKPEMLEDPRRAEIIKRHGYAYCEEFYKPHLALFGLAPNPMDVNPGFVRSNVLASFTANDLRFRKKNEGEKYKLLGSFKLGS